MAISKQITAYDAATSPARTDYLLLQPSAGGIYNKFTPAQLLGLLENSDLPAGTLGLGAALDGTVRAVGDGTTDSVLKISSTDVEVAGDLTLANLATLSAYRSGIGNATLRLDAIPNDGTSQGIISWFYNNNTTGATRFLMYRGTSLVHDIRTDGGNSDFCKDGSIFKVSGQVNFNALPTSSSGLSSGDLWIDTAAGRVIKVVA